MLEELLNKIDNSDQYIDAYSIEEEFINLLKELEKTGNKEEIILARLNYQFIIFVTNFDRGVVGRFSGTDEEGNIHEVPDINTYGPLEFEQLKKRFDQTNNPFLKSKYGLLLILSKNENAKPYKSNQIAQEICQSLLELSEKYKEKKEENPSVRIFLVNSVNDCLSLAQQRKFNEYIEHISNFVISTILGSKEADSVLLKFLRMIAKNMNSFVYNGEIEKILNHIMGLCKNSNTNKSFLIVQIAEVALELSQKLKLDQNAWLNFLGKKYEDMAEVSRESNMTDVSYLFENALKYYEKLNDTKKVGDLKLKIEESKKDIDIRAISTKIPDEYLSKTKERNQRLLQQDTATILHFLTSTIDIPPISEIKEIAVKTYSKSVMNLFPITPIDKFGNTLGSFTDEESKREFNTAQVYNNVLQIALITIAEVFSNTVRDGRINSDIFMHHLKESWIGQVKKVKYAHGEVEIELTKILYPSIKLIFEELTKSANGTDISVDNLVLAIDSITTKMEYLLRFLGFILKIPSFKYNRDGYQEQKNIYDYFREPRIIETFSEDDLYFLKYLLTEKVTGINLRGLVAHGLLDYGEYNIVQAMLLLIALLKIGQTVLE